MALRRNIVILTIIISIMVGFTGVAMAGTQDFTLVNNTGVDICKVYISPNDSNDWEENILHGVLYNGDSKFIRFSGYTTADWDIKVVDRTGQYLYWRGIDLNNVYKVTLYFDGSQFQAQCD